MPAIADKRYHILDYETILVRNYMLCLHFESRHERLVKQRGDIVFVEICREERRMDDQRFFFHLEGGVGNRFRLNEDSWLLTALDENPDMIDRFQNRDRNPERIVPWFGEFPGKVLTGMALNYRMSRSDRLLKATNVLVDRLIQVQDEEGYLGPHPAPQRLIGVMTDEPEGVPPTPLWDLWGHYHVIFGLTLWYRETGRTDCLDCALRAAGFILRFFKTRDIPFASAESLEMNHAISHAFTTLFLETGREVFLETARSIVDAEWSHPSAGNWLEAALSGVEFFETRKPRWESLHCILTLADLYRITKDRKYFTAFESIWQSILKTDRHNDGGFSSGEGACGDPYDSRAIETCCTIAWMVYSTEYWSLTRDSLVADELELSFMNAFLGSQIGRSGDYTYDTPMNGNRIPSSRELSWQGTPAGPRLNCCQVNGARGFGQVGAWGVDIEEDSIFLNYYGASTVGLRTPMGNRLVISQDTAYPLDGAIEIKMLLDSPETFALKLRIPFWSAKSLILVNGEPVLDIEAGTYATIRRLWQNDDAIRIGLDMSPHFWLGERSMAGRISIYTGPILMAFDREMSGIMKDVPLDIEDLHRIRIKACSSEPAMVEMGIRTSSGEELRLFDFADSGQTGREYSSWIPCTGLDESWHNSRMSPIWGFRRLPDLPSENMVHSKG